MPYTLSQLVDVAVQRLRRPDRVSDAAAFVNQTIRELHSTPEGHMVLFGKNMVEDVLTATAETGFLWIAPKGIQAIRTFQYPEVQSSMYPRGVYPEFLRPGRVLADKRFYYYRTGDSFAFQGYGGLGSLINVAYYAFLPRLAYYVAGTRPAEYDLITGWTYQDYYSTTAELQLQARNLVSNWMLEEWYDLILEGALAKLFKLVDDTTRAATHYSMFQTQRKLLLTSEEFESIGV